MIAPRFMGPVGEIFPPHWFRNWFLAVASTAMLMVLSVLSLAVYVVAKFL